MRPVELERKRHLRNEFIKSGAILLLAIVLLITAVFAWFGDDTAVSVDPFYISVKSEQDGTELGQDIVTDKSVILPSATKLGDDEISVNDFSKAIRVMPLEVESPLPNNVSISITVPKGLHYYIDTDYVAGTDTNLAYSQTINNNHTAGSGNDKDAVLIYTSDDFKGSVYKHMVAIIFWADYHYVDEKTGKTYGQIIDEEGALNLNAMMSFKIVLNTGE
ncbi:MAG: hypothetical protein IKT46_00150 [Clostridia bacterium]|nr:hypothetical protein [Clostridia bacterium]